MVKKKFDLYKEYELRGKGTAFKTYIPFEVIDHKVLCLGISAGASISEKDIEDFNNLVSKSLSKGNGKSLIEVGNQDKDEIDKFVNLLRENDGSVGKDKKKDIYNKIK